jgi:hypothetical protein
LYEAGAGKGVTIRAPQFEVHGLWVPRTCETANELKATVTTDRMITSPAATMTCELLIPPNRVRGRPGADG